MPLMTMVQALNNAFFHEMGKDKRVVVLGEDVGVDGGVFRVTEGLTQKFPDRVFDTPLSEDGIIGCSIGMASQGMRPVAEVQFSGFLYLGLNQILAHAAKLRNRSRGRFTGSLVVRAPYGAGVRALEHHSESTESLFIHIPGIKVVIPSTPSDAKGLLISAIRDPDPVIFFEPMRLYRAIKEEVPEGEYVVPLVQARVAREGDEVTLVTYGSMVRVCEQAADNLKQKGISCEIIDLRTLSPMDQETVINSVEKTGRCVVVHEAPQTLGMGAEISARIMEHAFDYLKAPVERVTAPDVPVPLPKLENYYLPDSFVVEKAVERVVKY